MHYLYLGREERVNGTITLFSRILKKDRGRSKLKNTYWFTSGGPHQTTLTYLTRWQIFYARERKYIYII